MKGPRIPGGYILLSRKIIESEIWNKPPLYLKVWVYILAKAQHKPYNNLERGQAFVSIPELIEVCSYKVGYRTEKPTKKQIYGILEWLRNPNEGVNDGNCEGNMIETTKVTHGMLVEVNNYNVYQDPKNYEGNNEGQAEGTTKEQRRDNKGNNKYKNVKNVKNENIPYGEIVDYLNQKTGKKFKPTTKKTKDVIHARWNDGHRLEDFKRVIDVCSSKWSGVTFSNGQLGDDYLQPSTLFNNKFEERLNWSIEKSSKKVDSFKSDSVSLLDEMGGM